jgi:hypothetical protein
MSILQDSISFPKRKHEKYLLIHNWRTAGTSTSSLLASNFNSSYLKVGLPFDGFGMPRASKGVHQITSLSEVRKNLHNHQILGGHLFAGLTSFLVGDWHLWMTARNPIKRAKSGVLRFYGHQYRGAKNPDKDLFYYTGKEKLDRPSDLITLFNENLSFERNGMCRRLAFMALAPSLKLAAEDNLEKIPEMSANYNNSDLYEAALMMLDKILLFIIPEWYTPSILCLEKFIDTGPIICPFTDLRLNGRTSRHASKARQAVVERSNDILAEIQQADLKLWKDIKERFKDQLSRYNISKRQVVVRDMVQAEPLFSHLWFVDKDLSDKKLIMGLSSVIAKRASRKAEIAEDVIATITSWRRFTPDAREKLHHYSHKSLNKIRG